MAVAARLLAVPAVHRWCRCRELILAKGRDALNDRAVSGPAHTPTIGPQVNAAIRPRITGDDLLCTCRCPEQYAGVKAY